MAQKRRTPKTGEMPSREALLAYIGDHGGDVNRRDIARAFGLRGNQRTELRQQLRALED